MKRQFFWQEMDNDREMYITGDGIPVITFPITYAGYVALDDLIENLKQMRDEIENRVKFDTEVSGTGSVGVIRNPDRINRSESPENQRENRGVSERA